MKQKGKGVERAAEESRDKATKDKATAGSMRNKAMQSLSETKKRAGSDLSKKQRKHNINDTLEYLREAGIEVKTARN